MRVQRITNGLIWIPIVLALWISAAVNLQLFQDGAEYLFDLVQNEAAAIMHQRVSGFLVQLPTALLVKVLIHFPVDIPRKMDLIRFSFSLSYSLIPLICFTTSWGLVQSPHHRRLLIWPALLLLQINLVNFSWVSEILIALQIACPLFLVTIVMPGSRISWSLVLLLLSMIFGLHPLAIALFLIGMIGMMYLGFARPEHKKMYQGYALLFLGAALFKGLALRGHMSDYEKRFLESHHFNSYFFSTSPENQIFLAIALTLASVCLLAKILHRSGIPLSRSYGMGIGLAILGPCILIFQYQYAIFQLKTGLSIIVSLIILLMMCVDSDTPHQMNQQHWHRWLLVQEDKWRFRLVTVLSIMFALVIILKSLIWHTSVQKLQATLVHTPTPCIELGADELSWLHQSPYKMINTWAITSLALLDQNQSPRKILLGEGCQIYYETGQIKLHPWKTLHKDKLMPQL